MFSKSKKNIYYRALRQFCKYKKKRQGEAEEIAEDLLLIMCKYIYIMIKFYLGTRCKTNVQTIVEYIFNT